MRAELEVVKPDYTAAAVPPDSELAKDPATPRLGDLWRVGVAFFFEVPLLSNGFWHSFRATIFLLISLNALLPHMC